MGITPAPRYFFVHVMKTGGRTLLRHLRDNFELDELYPYGKIDIRYQDDRVDINHHLEMSTLMALPEERRERIRVYSGHYPFVASELLGGDFVTITILREPVARTISLLRQFRRNDPWADPNESRGAPFPKLTLEEVYEHPMVFEPLVHNHQTKVFSVTAADTVGNFMDVVEVDRSRLERAKTNLATVDVIGVTEAYEAFLRDLTAMTGWRVQPELRKNVTPSEDVQPVSDELRRRIAEDNVLDIELYDYARELIAARRRVSASQ
jgi:hypothetical protein